MLKSNISKFYIWRAVGLLISLMFNILLLQNISPSDYGNWTILNLVISFSIILTSFGTRKLYYNLIDSDNNSEILNSLFSQILVIWLILFIPLLLLGLYFYSLSTLIVSLGIILIMPLAQLSIIKIEKINIKLVGKIELLTSNIIKSIGIYLLSLIPELGLLIFLIPTFLSGLIKFFYSILYSKTKILLTTSLNNLKFSFNYFKTNISDYVVANIYRFVLVTSFSIDILGTIDRAFNYLKIPYHSYKKLSE